MQAKPLVKQPVGKARKLRLDTLLRIRTTQKSLRKPLRQHQRNVTHYVPMLAAQVIKDALRGSKSLDVNVLRDAARLHDVSKGEWSESKKLSKPKYKNLLHRYQIAHVDAGTKTVEAIVSKKAATIVAAHHERINGSGYPLKLKGRKIPLEAQMLGIIDVYCALREGRPYREKHYKYSKEEAIEVLDKEADAGKFDKNLVYSFIEVLVNERGDYFRA